MKEEEMAREERKITRLHDTTPVVLNAPDTRLHDTTPVVLNAPEIGDRRTDAVDTRQ